MYSYSYSHITLMKYAQIYSEQIVESRAQNTNSYRGLKLLAAQFGLVFNFENPEISDIEM